jgi:hypothetical protein
MAGIMLAFCFVMLIAAAIRWGTAEATSRILEHGVLAFVRVMLWGIASSWTIGAVIGGVIGGVAACFDELDVSTVSVGTNAVETGHAQKFRYETEGSSP